MRLPPKASSKGKEGAGLIPLSLVHKAHQSVGEAKSHPCRERYGCRIGTIFQSSLTSGRRSRRIAQSPRGPSESRNTQNAREPFPKGNLMANFSYHGGRLLSQ